LFSLRLLFDGFERKLSIVPAAIHDEMQAKCLRSRLIGNQVAGGSLPLNWI
jgi:hypothetical protein